MKQGQAHLPLTAYQYTIRYNIVLVCVTSLARFRHVVACGLRNINSSTAVLISRSATVTRTLCLKPY